MRVIQRLPPAALAAAAVALSAGVAFAQFGGGEFMNVAPRYMPEVLPDRDFIVCRLQYSRVRYEPSGGGWRTDYPFGEINLSIRLSELTRTRVSTNGDRDPNHYVVTLTDRELFECPFVMASDVGTAGLTGVEAEALRAYLLKGGFLWVDDFWGPQAWEHWEGEIAKALDPGQFPIEDVALSDPLFQAQFVVTAVPQISNISHWRRTRGRETSERGAETAEPHLRAIRDARGRIMVLMTHDTDIADSWEREGDDPAFFEQFSPDGYALGINVLLHAMTH